MELNSTLITLPVCTPYRVGTFDLPSGFLCYHVATFCTEDSIKEMVTLWKGWRKRKILHFLLHHLLPLASLLIHLKMNVANGHQIGMSISLCEAIADIALRSNNMGNSCLILAIACRKSIRFSRDFFILDVQGRLTPCVNKDCSNDCHFINLFQTLDIILAW